MRWTGNLGYEMFKMLNEVSVWVIHIMGKQGQFSIYKKACQVLFPSTNISQGGLDLVCTQSLGRKEDGKVPRLASLSHHSEKQ